MTLWINFLAPAEAGVHKVGNDVDGQTQISQTIYDRNHI